jgi:hypothetical protein
MIKNKDMVSSLGQMVENIWVSGVTVNNMDKELCMIRMERMKEQEIG